MYLDGALVKVGVVHRVVDEFGELRLTHLVRLVTKDKEKSVDGVRLARTVRPHDGREGLKIKYIGGESQYLNKLAYE